MDLINKIAEIASRIFKQREHVLTEEATKNAFIMPFIAALGYDVFNPMEVVPEFTADVGIKKGEKVDYAIKKDDKIILLIECKSAGSKLGKDFGQLHRYFHAVDARFGILTNGINYQFFTDLEKKNKMDDTPFFEFNILDFKPHQIQELKKFTKSSFSLEDILKTASELKYSGQIKKILDEELKKPSEEFIKFFVSKIYDGRLTQKVIIDFNKIVQDAAEQFMDEKIDERLDKAKNYKINEDQDRKATQEECVEKNFVTTQEELDGYNIVRAILSESINVERIFIRDNKSYCGILLDDNNRKPICRLRFNNNSQKSISIFLNKQEEVVKIDSLNNIFDLAKKLKATVLEYDNTKQ